MSFFQAAKQMGLMTLLTVMMLNHVQAIERVNNSPLRLWGDISSIYRTRDVDVGDSNTSDWLNIGTVNASSYIWRPWFAVANGGLSLAVDERKASGQPDLKDEFVTGNLNFGLFPTSRFPFRLYYNENRNESDDVLFKRDTTTTEFGASQQYRSPSGKQNYRADYKRNKQDSSSSADVLAERLFFTGTNQFENQSLNTDISFATVDSSTQDVHSSSYAATGRHSYSSTENFSIENLISASQIKNDLVQSQSEVETAQFSSLLSWRPAERNDLNVTASFRLSDLALQQTQSASSTSNLLDATDSSNANISQGLTYQFSDRLQITESINFAYSKADDDQQFIGNENIGISYNSERTTTLLGDYGWTLGSSYGHQHGDTENLNSLNSQFRHSLSNDFSVSEKYSLRTTLSQALSYDYQSTSRDKKNASNTFSLTWSKSSGSTQSQLRLLISDRRSLEENKDFFQLANLQYSGILNFNRNAMLSGNLTLQMTKQENDGTESISNVTNGRLEYSHNRLFQFPRLRFRSQLKFSEQQSENERLLSSVSDGDVSDASLENSLHYRIGRLETSMNLDFVKTGNTLDRIFKIQLTRSFGDL